MDWIEWMWKVESGKWKRKVDSGRKVDVESGKWKVARFRISHVNRSRDMEVVPKFQKVGHVTPYRPILT